MFIYLIKLISVCFINGLESRHISSTLRIDGRIVGGMNAKIDNFPYQLSLRYNGRHICGASIISQKYAITAAHCTDGTTPRSLSLRAGSTFFNQGGQIIQVYKIHQHPKFDIYTVDYDVAILETTNKININNKTTRTIKLTDEEAMEGNLAIVSGWGTLEEDGPGLPIRLQMVQLPIVNRRQCESAYFKINRISSRMICAGFVEAGGKDSCQGDSGGPMVSNGRLSGIVSWGYGCGRQTYPGVYTNLGNKEIRQFVQNVANV